MIDSLKQLLVSQHWKDLSANHPLRDRQSGMRVNLTQSAANGLVIKVPTQHGAHPSMIKDGPPLHLLRTCDYLVLVPNGDRVDACLIEMKKTLWVNDENVPEAPCQQILSTIPVFEYLRSKAEVHSGKRQNAKLHFVVIAKAPAANYRKRFREQFTECIYQRRRFRLFCDMPEPEIQLGHLWQTNPVSG